MAENDFSRNLQIKTCQQNHRMSDMTIVKFYYAVPLKCEPVGTNAY